MRARLLFAVVACIVLAWSEIAYSQDSRYRKAGIRLTWDSWNTNVILQKRPECPPMEGRGLRGLKPLWHMVSRLKWIPRKAIVGSWETDMMVMDGEGVNVHLERHFDNDGTWIEKVEFLQLNAKDIRTGTWIVKDGYLSTTMETFSKRIGKTKGIFAQAPRQRAS